MDEPRLKHFGWGREGEGLTPEEEAFAWRRIRERVAIDDRVVSVENREGVPFFRRIGKE